MADENNRRFDVLVVGAGFTGLTAALSAAENGASVAVIEAGEPGWGASGRNGGFCGIGGDNLGLRAIVWRYGRTAAARYWAETQELAPRVLERNRSLLPFP